MAAGENLDPFLCTVLVGLARLISTIIGAFLIEKSGRRNLLFSTVTVCAVAITTAGLVLLLGQNFPGGKFIPLICVLVYCLAYGTGVGPVPWALMGELLPSPVRTISSSIVCVGFSSSIFLIANVFPKMLDDIGLGYSFIIFGIFNIVKALVVWFFLPETKGRSLLELEVIFKGKKENIKSFSKENQNQFHDV